MTKGSTLSANPDTASFTDADNQIAVTANIRDDNDNPLGNGYVNFTVAYTEGSVLKTGGQMSYGDRVGVWAQDSDHAGSATLILDDFATGDDAGAVEVKVSATYSGATGSLNLGDITIGRPGPLDSVAAAACMMDAKNTDKEDGCGAGSKPMSLFNPDDSFDVMAKAMDAIGTELTPTTFEVSVADADKANFDQLASTGKTTISSGKASIKIADDAKGGDYTLTVTAKTGTGASEITKTADVMVTIAGPAAMLSFPEGKQANPIPADGVGRFTVKVTDANGNLPHNVGKAADDFQAVITLRPTKATVVGNPTQTLQFDAKTGEASFFVQVADEAVQGDTVTITVSASDDSTIDSVTLTVTYGEAQEPQPDVLTAPTNIRVNPVGSGLVNVGWDPVPGAAGYTIVAVMKSDPSQLRTESVNNPNATAGQIGNLMVGEKYNIYVGAFNADLEFKVDLTSRKEVTIE